VKNVRFPGFRPGKVPRKLFEAQYGQQLFSEAVDDVVPQAYARALEEHELEPLARPEMEMLEGNDDAALRFKATVPVRPQIELKDYRGLELTATSAETTDEAVDQAIEAMRRDAATLVPVERPVRLGDTATIDYEGKIDGVPFEGGTANGKQTEVSAERFIPGFAEGIVGMTAGETKDVPAKFPDAYGAKELAGKDAVFTITVHDIKEAELPPVDDEFAKRVSKSETGAALREDVKRRLAVIAAQKSRRDLVDRLLERLLDLHDVPVPQVLAQSEIEGLLADSRSYVARYGSSWEDYLTATGKTEETLREEYRAEAERRVKTTLLIGAIARAEKVDATRAEIDAELDGLAQQYGQPKEKILELTSADRPALIDGIIRTKTIDLILDAAKIAPPATKADAAESEA